MKLRKRNFLIFIIYIVTPFIIIPILNHYHVGNLELTIINLIMWYIFIQPFIIFLPVWAFVASIIVLKEFLFEPNG